MTNKEKWASLTDHMCSPQSYIDWTWRFIISCALQRRVWYGPEHMQCHANMYGILYGPPGLGKSLCLDMAKSIISSPLKKDVKITKTQPNNSEAELFVIAKTEEANLKAAEESMIKSKISGVNNDPPLFISAPDAVSFEALVETFGKSLRRTNYSKDNGDGTNKVGIYTHCSTYFCLDELGSLFRKKQDSIITLLLSMYGCPKNYEYKTKHNGEDRIINGCLSFLAGTTAEFMEDILKDKLIGKGFTARCFFICAHKKRKPMSSSTELTTEQIQYKKDLIEHIKKLYPLVGEAKVEPSTAEWFHKWWVEYESHPERWANKSSRLLDYFVRKNIHVIKVAMQEHFGESTEMLIPKWRFEQAIEILEKEEPTMHLALTNDADNPLTKVTNKIFDYIVKNKEAQVIDLITEFWDYLPQGRKSLDEVLSQLTMTDKLELKTKETGEIVYRERNESI